MGKTYKEQATYDYLNDNKEVNCIIALRSSLIDVIGLKGMVPDYLGININCIKTGNGIFDFSIGCTVSYTCTVDNHF